MNCNVCFFVYQVTPYFRVSVLVMLLRNLSLRLANRVALRTTTPTTTTTIAAPFTTTRSIFKKYDPLPSSKGSFKVDNPNLKDLEGDDYLYHLGLNPAEDDLQRFFHDVKFVCMGGSVGRMEEFAQSVADELGEHESVAIPYGMRPSAIGKTDRYSMFKVGPVLISSHGMGQPSMSILLHEVAKLLDYAGAVDPVFIRLGTSGGLGVKPGTVVVTNEGAESCSKNLVCICCICCICYIVDFFYFFVVDPTVISYNIITLFFFNFIFLIYNTKGVNGLLGSDYTLPVNGKLISRPSKFHAETVQGVMNAVAKRPEVNDLHVNENVVVGKTMAADCFYEGQGRLDGAICE